jgi:hypothetical protein
LSRSQIPHLADTGVATSALARIHCHIQLLLVVAGGRLRLLLRPRQLDGPPRGRALQERRQVCRLCDGDLPLRRALLESFGDVLEVGAAAPARTGRAHAGAQPGGDGADQKRQLDGHGQHGRSDSSLVLQADKPLRKAIVLLCCCPDHCEQLFHQVDLATAAAFGCCRALYPCIYIDLGTIRHAQHDQTQHEGCE